MSTTGRQADQLRKHLRRHNRDLQARVARHLLTSVAPRDEQDKPLTEELVKQLRENGQ